MNVIRVRERRMWMSDHSQGSVSTDNEAPLEGLQLLRTYCKTGVHNAGGAENEVLLAKELLYYRVLDMFAQVYCAREAHVEISKSKVPLMTSLVSTLNIFRFQECTDGLTFF